LNETASILLKFSLKSIFYQWFFFFRSLIKVPETLATSGFKHDLSELSFQRALSVQKRCRLSLMGPWRQDVFKLTLLI
jgi:hypothetical protein